MLTASQRYAAIVQWLQANTNLSARSSNWIAAKAMHETGRFTSAIFRENNNLFGMKQPTQRQTLATGTARGHATFRTYHENMIDYIYYLRNFRNNPNDFRTLRGWLQRLKNDLYYEDTFANYSRGTIAMLDPQFRNVELSAPPEINRFAQSNWSTPVILRNELTI